MKLVDYVYYAAVHTPFPSTKHLLLSFEKLIVVEDENEKKRQKNWQENDIKWKYTYLKW